MTDERKNMQNSTSNVLTFSTGTLCLALLATSSMSDVIVVDNDGTADFNTIAAGLAAATDGDTVLIRAGTYFEQNLNLSGNITIEGEVGSDLLPAVTIDAQGSWHLRFLSGDYEMELRNLTFTGSLETSCSTFHANPTLVNCTFLDNGPLEPLEFGLGGAFYNLNSAPVFIDCRFLENRGGFGGAFATWESGPDPAAEFHPRFEGCTFRGNSAHWGGAMANLRSNPTVIDCLFEDNSSLNSGGAIVNDGFSPPDFWISRPTIMNCVFQENTAGVGGGAIMNQGTSEATVIGCTFHANTAGSGGAVMSDDDSFATLIDTIACGNLPDQITGAWQDDGGNSINAECESTCTGDLNDDQTVDGADLTLLLSAWNQQNADVDLNQDGLVNGADLTILLSVWGDCLG
jgi:hypothetical protein